METAAPSGIFCMPMPKATTHADNKASSEKPSPSAPKATPTANPSGMLCNVIANTSNKLRRNEDVPPSLRLSSRPTCRCGSILCNMYKVKPPARNPRLEWSQAGLPAFVNRSMEGRSRDQKLAAIIIPEAKPSIPLKIGLGTVRKKNTKEAPNAVQNQVNPVANRPKMTGWRWVRVWITINQNLCTGLQIA